MQVTPPASPPPSYLGSMAYDADGREVVLYGGSGLTSRYTWIWDDENWSTRASRHVPGERVWAGIAYHRQTKAVVLFGGCDRSACEHALNDTWTWDGSDWTLKRLRPAPSKRWSPAMADYRLSDNVVLFGGFADGCDCPKNDTWIWQGSVWVKQNPATAPPARGYAAMAYDHTNDQLVLFGGYDGITGEFFGDTWLWSNTWTKQSPPTSPSPRIGHTMAYDYGSGELVLFGGLTEAGFANDTWAWDESTWVQRPSPQAPDARWFQQMAGDASSRNVVLFGGQIDNPGNIAEDTWIWD